MLRYLKGNESESKSQQNTAAMFGAESCCVTSKVMNLKANHNNLPICTNPSMVVALPQR